MDSPRRRLSARVELRFFRMFATWRSVVPIAITHCCEICWFVIPLATSAITWRSRGVRGPSGALGASGMASSSQLKRIVKYPALES
jgi:hypothetical protein